MTSPQQPPKTILGQVTQAIQTIQAKVNFNALALKPNAKVPELWVQDAGAAKAEIYPMLGDRYLLGRSSKSCDIVIRNPVVSQVHLSVSRDPKHQKSFIIKDENSTNGIYRGRRRLQSLELRHGDILTLGPPELADAVRLQYYNPPPLYVLAFRYGLYGAGALVSLIAFLILYEWRNIPIRPLPVAVQGPVIVNSDEGTPLQRPRTEAHRELRRLSDFSKYLPAAVLASEDSRYHWHFGVDPIGTLRAVVTNVKGGGIRQGGSTLTQQLARSLYRDYVGTEDSAGRKIREAIVALKLETFYSKDEILRNYMNRIYLGVGASGFEDAAQFYFEKSARDLDISEAATLVAILPAPNSYNPIRDYKTAVGLRDRIITRMVSQGRISAEEGQRARRSRIEVSPKAREALANIKAPYFYSYVVTELRTLLGEQLAKEGNFIVETNLDLETQQKAETSLRNSVNTSGSSYGFSQGAIVTLDSSTGAIRALVGGTDYEKSQFNRATQAKRQPGSTFKVFAYASALEQGNSPGKFYSCAPLVWQNQRFRACERVGGSGTDMYTGMAQSENVVALRVAQDVGLNRVVEMAQRLGITTPLNPVPGLVLGQSETTLLEMTGAFAAIENNGVWNRAHAIKRILDSSDCTDFKNPQTCRVIYSFEEETGATKRVLPQGIADTMNVMLRSVVRSGTGRAASIGVGNEAGKTGTTNSGVDLLFIGYVPSRDLVTGVWLGNDDNSPTRGSSGQAAQAWANYMRQVVR
ncbi:transglycosylase domain-containing protein [Cyanobacteria bacterium FACHB-472]|nr:transglycosylase domain-containing protein [Cyanobacteria bacterium FACHB-472]